MDGLLNIMRRESERVVARNSSWSVGTVSSYDPATNAAKVQLQPEDTQSGWLPVNSLFVGNGFGISIGVTVGTACLVHFQDGDREAGVIMGFFYTDAEQPVAAKEGELIIQTKDGSLISFLQDKSVTIKQAQGATILLKDDGSITATDKGGASVALDGSGNIVATPAGTGFVYLGGKVGALPVMLAGGGASTKVKAI